jgi:hypothetical protein
MRGDLGEGGCWRGVGGARRGRMLGVSDTRISCLDSVEMAMADGYERTLPMVCDIVVDCGALGGRNCVGGETRWIKIDYFLAEKSQVEAMR